MEERVYVRLPGSSCSSNKSGLKITMINTSLAGAHVHVPTRAMPGKNRDVALLEIITWHGRFHVVTGRVANRETLHIRISYVRRCGRGWQYAEKSVKLPLVWSWLTCSNFEFLSQSHYKPGRDPYLGGSGRNDHV